MVFMQASIGTMFLTRPWYGRLARLAYGDFL